MRLIDADELLKLIPPEEVCSRFVVANAPTVEPQCKTGHWILHTEQEKNIFGVKTIECSECGDKCLVQFVEKEKYCRNCGAKMEAENDDIPIEYFESGGI